MIEGLNLQIIGVTASKIFGRAKDFCPNLLQLVRKIIHEDLLHFLGVTHQEQVCIYDLQNCLHVFSLEKKSQSQTYFDGQLHLHAMRTKVLKYLCRDFQGFCLDFQGFFPDFRQIKILGVRLHHLQSRLLHRWYRSNFMFIFSNHYPNMHCLNKITETGNRAKLNKSNHHIRKKIEKNGILILNFKHSIK